MLFSLSFWSNPALPYQPSSANVVVETNTVGGAGQTDLIQSSVTYTVSTNVENLTLTGTAAINATGNISNIAAIP